MRYIVVYTWQGERHRVLPPNGVAFTREQAIDAVRALRADKWHAWMESAS